MKKSKLTSISCIIMLLLSISIILVSLSAILEAYIMDESYGEVELGFSYREPWQKFNRRIAPSIQKQDIEEAKAIHKKLSPNSAMILSNESGVIYYGSPGLIDSSTILELPDESHKIFNLMILSMISKGVFSKDLKPKDLFAEQGWPAGEYFDLLTVQDILQLGVHDVFTMESCLTRREVDINTLTQCVSKLFSEMEEESFPKHKYYQNLILTMVALRSEKLEIDSDNIVKLLSKYVYEPAGIKDHLSLKLYYYYPDLYNIIRVNGYIIHEINVAILKDKLLNGYVLNRILNQPNYVTDTDSEGNDVLVKEDEPNNKSWSHLLGELTIPHMDNEEMKRVQIVLWSDYGYESFIDFTNKVTMVFLFDWKYVEAKVRKHWNLVMIVMSVVFPLSVYFVLYALAEDDETKVVPEYKEDEKATDEIGEEDKDDEDEYEDEKDDDHNHAHDKDKDNEIEKSDDIE